MVQNNNDRLMKERNVLHTININIPKTLSIEEIKSMLLTLYEGEKVYSYVITSVYKKQILDGITLTVHTSQNDRYNRIDGEHMTQEVLRAAKDLYSKQEHAYVIGFGQPSIELQLEVFEPYMQKLAGEQFKKWEIPYDELYQLCRISMFKLYSKGYYVNHKLLRQTFINDVLMLLRKQPKYETISLYACKKNVKNNDNMYLYDSVEDERATKQFEDIDDKSEEDDITGYQKELIIAQVGEEAYKQLLEEYGNKRTTEWSRRTVHKLKHKFQKDGLTSKELYRND